jgi:PAS domain S-box-containing protein
MSSWTDRANKAGGTGISEGFSGQQHGAKSDFRDVRGMAADRATSPLRFRELADALPQIVWSCDASGKIDYLNRRWYELTGKLPGDLDPSGVIHPDDVERARAAFRRAVEHGLPYQEEYRLCLPGEPEPRWYLGRALPVRDGAGRIIRWYATSTDIHVQKQKEDALRAADRQKDEFLGILAHEIRNPLAPMMYSAAILERRIQDPELRRPLEVIARQARRMIRIVDDLLDVSRVTQGKISLQRDRIGVADLLAQCAEASRPLMESRRHTFLVEVADPSLTVNADAVRLTQVVENLLINAAKYTADGGQVTLSARAEGPWVAISVRDSGIGISSAMLDRVFDLFAQADTSLDRAEGGLGIGLTLVDRLVRMHGGRVDVQSPGLGHGSTFTVRLPLIARLDEADDSDRPSVDTPRRRVLIVDDNVDSAELLGALLEVNGHSVKLAHDGRAAVSAAQALGPDFVLLDIGLPGLDGYHVLKELRGMPGVADATIVATTGYGREEDRTRCLAAGFDEHLTKPVDIARVQRILSSNPQSAVRIPRSG